MWGGVVTHFSAQKGSTSCTTDLKNIPLTLGLTPSLPKIINRCAQLFLALSRFPTTTGQSFPKSIMIQPRYFKYVTDSRGML